MGNSERELAGACRWWSPRVMVPEPEGYDRFVDRALVREGLHVREVPVRNRVDSHEAGSALDAG